MVIPLIAMVRKDLLIFFSDRRSVIVSFLVPIAIASFFGSIFSGPSRGNQQARIDVMVVDRDGSVISRSVVTGATADANLRVTQADEQTARETVRRGKTSVAVIIPPGFGDAAGAALFGGADKPQLGMLYDPSRSMELAMVRGILTAHLMQAVTREMFGGAQGQTYLEKIVPQIEASEASGLEPRQKQLLLQMLRSVQSLYGEPARSGTAPGGLTMPYTVREEAMTAGTNAAYNGYAHSFAGMGIQFLLFAMANLGVEMLLERQRGLWKRLRSAPVSRFTLLLGKGISGALISLMILGVSFVFAMLAFGVRIEGGLAGFVGVAVACSLMASAFGLLVAALGNTPATARGVTTLAVLMMVMLGGAWVPTFIFPAWLQQLTVVVPVRWAVDGLDAMTWRGVGSAGAVVPILVLLAFAALFAVAAALRFRWEETS
ncbi:MAG TPA: ABC transporter permease [Vicinamibacterales bacterium]|jgi:ABC-2 type transport system permease protein|nr:ABC transporter permease [Vicinamibacterales bacterium]